MNHNQHKKCITIVFNFYQPPKEFAQDNSFQPFDVWVPPIRKLSVNLIFYVPPRTASIPPGVCVPQVEKHLFKQSPVIINRKSGFFPSKNVIN
jgi:hypothetical protein